MSWTVGDALPEMSAAARAIDILCAGRIDLVLTIVIARIVALLEAWPSPHRRAAPALPGLDVPLELGAIR